ncbi:MAG: LLM class flavin-dependent oxidoreductase, partial [Alphaproteobacteria bacterium]|nr:LLM class flavin-dependent oxidoreductase [Alphaproteobacteria bacterium]
GSAFGTPEHVAERIITYAQEAQTNHWMAEMKFGGMNHEDTMRSMRLFAQEVIPRVNDRLGKDAAA